jgi:hypothetical protein
MFSSIKNAICWFLGIPVKVEQKVAQVVENKLSETFAVTEKIVDNTVNAAEKAVDAVVTTTETAVAKVEEVVKKKRNRKAATGEPKEKKPRAPRKSKKVNSATE